MKLISDTGIEIELDFNADGFPVISINTGGNYQGDSNRPTVEVTLNGVMIQTMFDHSETDKRWRWNQKLGATCPSCGVGILEDNANILEHAKVNALEHAKVNARGWQGRVVGCPECNQHYTKEKE